ncbi:MAG: glycosyltransferase family 2 protein [Chitinophagaceae bacterium]
MEIQPLLSIGIPTYNRPDGLEKVLNYLVNQEYQNIEIIVSDNSSSNTRVKEILEHYAAQDHRIKYFIQSENIEIEPNFNFVYSKCLGDYFMWMSDDDAFSQNYIAECISFLETNNDFLLCSGISFYYNSNVSRQKENPITLDSKWPLIRLLFYFLRVNKNGLFYGVYRKSYKFNCPIKKHIGSDWCYIAKISLLGKIKTIDACEIHRSNDGGSSSRTKIVKRWNAKGFKKIFIESYTAHQIASNLFSDNITKYKYSISKRFLIQFFVFILLNLKFLGNSISRRIVWSQ